MASVLVRVRNWLNHYAGVLLVVGALIIGAAYYSQVQDETARARCQAQYNQAFAGQLIERSRLFAESDDARDTLIKAVGASILAPPAKTVKEQKQRGAAMQQLFRDYNTRSAEIEADRAATPLPPIPECH
jgi:uncharacterized protein HemX